MKVFIQPGGSQAVSGHDRGQSARPSKGPEAIKVDNYTRKINGPDRLAVIHTRSQDQSPQDSDGSIKCSRRRLQYKLGLQRPARASSSMFKREQLGSSPDLQRVAIKFLNSPSDLAPRVYSQDPGARAVSRKQLASGAAPNQLRDGIRRHCTGDASPILQSSRDEVRRGRPGPIHPRGGLWA
eukprot:3806422-Prymnesium_polylepis.1